MIPEAEPLNDEVILHITASVHRSAELYSEREGLSLDQFVDQALAEKLAHLQHLEWMKSRRPMTEERRARALELLGRIGSDEVEPGDEIPEGYVRR